MAFFRKPKPEQQPEQTQYMRPEPQPSPPQMTMQPPRKSDGVRLMEHFREHLRDVPEKAIIEEWSNHENPNAYPTRCPSAVAEAFFLHPHDEAVVFFERYLFPVERFESDYDTDVLNFVMRCKNRALASYVSHSVEVFGVEDTLRRIAEGLKEDETLSTQVLNLLEANR